ncbi:MAG: formyltransferase family protein [Actinomycetota bacterium]|nr:formyltransferase family protein [Actinomycetota bacterium]
MLSKLLQLDADFRVVVMERESVMPEIPKNIASRDRSNFDLHFKNRLETESAAFGELTFRSTYSGIDMTVCNSKTLNSKETVDFVKRETNDVCIVFGSDLINGDLLQSLPTLSLNFHLGLSPWYKGSATLFWPFFFMEPQCAGITIHKIVAAADAGEILHQSVPILKTGMGIHDVGVATVLQGVNDLVSALKKIIVGTPLNFTTQRTLGRLFLTRDFEPHHLRINYDLFNDRMVDQYLSGQLGNKTPKLIANL